MSNTTEALQKAIEVIKTQEVRRGLNTTESDIAQKLNLSGAQLTAYLRGEAVMPDGFVTAAYAAYGITVKRAELRTKHDVHITKD